VLNNYIGSRCYFFVQDKPLRRRRGNLKQQEKEEIASISEFILRNYVKKGLNTNGSLLIIKRKKRREP
jgi:hypothetical protein